MALIQINDLECPVKELNSSEMKGIYGGWWSWNWFSPWSWFQPVNQNNLAIGGFEALKTVSAFRW